jgi:hypothetical protein
MKHQWTTRLATVLMGAVLAGSALHASAQAGLDGHTFRVDYGVDLGLGTGFQALVGLDVVGEGAAGTLTISSTNSWSILADASTVFLRYTGSGDFMNAGTPSFIGFRISDQHAQLEPIIGATVVNTTYVQNQQGNLLEGFAPATDLTRPTADAVMANLWHSMYHHHPMGSMGDPTRDLIAIQVNLAPVPEPGTYAMMGAGLLGIGFAARRAQRKR